MANDDSTRPLLSSDHVKDDCLNVQEKKAFHWLESFFMKHKFSFKQVFIMFGVYLGLGTICFSLIMHQISGKKTNGVIDAIYFCVVTMTTVGYGDLVPNSIESKLLASVYVFIGMGFVGIFLSKAADYIVEKQEVVLFKAINMYQKKGSTEINKEIETHKALHKFAYSAAVLVVLILLGIAFLYVFESFELADAFYCVCSTITTLGYGDESFSSKTGRLFAAFWILSSTICLAQFFVYLTDFYTEIRQTMLMKRIMTRSMTSADLESADIDHDKVVTFAEFIVYTLKEMGKIEEDDISLVMERFRKLDIDHSGTLTEADLVHPQSS